MLECPFNKGAGLQHSCFPVNIAKFLRTAFLIEHLWRLLLNTYQPFLPITYCLSGSM